MELTKLEASFFETLDLMCRLKLGVAEEGKTTDTGARFVFDVFDLLCNIMRADDKCFHKLCEYYKSVNASLPDGAGVTPDEALATKYACERAFFGSGVSK